MVRALLDRLEQRRAQRGRQRQGHQRREEDRGHHRQRELAIDRAHRAREERHRDEHRHQHQRDADDGAGDLAHGLASRFARGQALLAHDPLDVFHHHDGVVDEDTDRQHQAEHGQHVDREAQRVHGGEGAQQRDRHHDRRDQGVADVLQEHQHHQEHQRHGLEQRLDHFLDRDLHELGGVVRDLVLDAGREVLGELVELGLDRLGRAQRVARRRELHADGRDRLAVDPRGSRVGLAAQLQARHVLDAHLRAVRLGHQHDVAELLGGRHLPLHHHRRRDGLVGGGRQVAQRAGRDQCVLVADGVVDVGRRQLVADQLGRVDPDAHRALGAEQHGLADAGHALDFVEHVARDVVAQGDRVHLAVLRDQRGEQQEVGAGLVDLHALLRHRRRQARFHALEAVLHVHLRQRRIGAGLERHGDGGLAVTGLADRLDIEQAVRTVHFLLDDAGDGVVQRLGARARVGCRDDDRGRRDGRVLRDRQLGDRDGPSHDDEQREHPGKDRAIDKKLCHAMAPCLLRLTAWLRGRWRQHPDPARRRPATPPA